MLAGGRLCFDMLNTSQPSTSMDVLLRLQNSRYVKIL
jgi:hypothetical protein